MHRANSRRPTSPDSTPRIKCTMMVDATRVGVLGPNCARHILLLATLHLLDKAWRKKRVSWCDLYLGLSLPHLSCHDMRCYEWDEMRTRHASKGKKKDKKKRGEPRTSLCRGGAHCTPWLDSSDPKKKMATNPAFEAKSRWLAAAKSERLCDRSINIYPWVCLRRIDRSISSLPWFHASFSNLVDAFDHAYAPTEKLQISELLNIYWSMRRRAERCMPATPVTIHHHREMKPHHMYPWWSSLSLHIAFG